MEKEAQNPEFAFLYNLASPEHAYYRWRLFSLSQGALLRPVWLSNRLCLPFLHASAQWCVSSLTHNLSMSDCRNVIAHRYQLCHDTLLMPAGDTLRTWRTDPFVLLAGGPQWIPPTLPTATLAQQTAAQRGGDSKVGTPAHGRLLI